MTEMDSSKNLVLLDTAVRQDESGRFCLNDLHKAAGGENRHKPNLWLHNQQTIDLVNECEIAGIPAILTKQGLGTFAVKDLVYSYAMWISPAFHLKVIRAYDAMMASPAFDIPKTYADALQLAANQAKQLEVQSLIIEQQAPAVAFHKQVTENDGDLMRIEEACALLKRKTGQDFNQTTWLSFLRENGIAKLQNKYAGIGPKKFVPKAEYVPKWFVSSLSEHGVQMWLVRPVAVEQVFQMIERQRKSPDFLPILARRLLNHLTPSGSFLN